MLEEYESSVTNSFEQQQRKILYFILLKNINMDCDKGPNHLLPYCLISLKAFNRVP